MRVPESVSKNLEDKKAAVSGDRSNPSLQRNLKRAQALFDKAVSAKKAIEDGLKKVRESEYGQNRASAFNRLDRAKETYWIEALPESSSGFVPQEGKHGWQLSMDGASGYRYTTMRILGLRPDGREDVQLKRERMGVDDLLVHEIRHLADFLKHGESGYGRLERTSASGWPAFNPRETVDPRWGNILEYNAVKEANRYRASIGKPQRSARLDGYDSPIARRNRNDRYEFGRYSENSWYRSPHFNNQYNVTSP